ncbi:hypothetical protein B4U79_03153, partial [Dinothrombium tinctorium]
MRVKTKVKRKLIAISVIISFVSLSYFYTQNVFESKFFEEWKSLRSSLNASGECLLPLNVNPFDSRVTPYLIKMPNRIHCPKTELSRFYSIGANGESLTFVDENGILKKLNVPHHLNCVYQNFSRKGDSDDEIVYSEEKPLLSELNLIALNIEFVSVKCHENGDLVYSNTHFYPSTLKQLPKSDEYLPSVIILVIESMSRLNYLRFLKQTKSAFESLGNFFYLKGLTKLADNSFPNMVPLLAGLRPYEGEFPPNVRPDEGPYDDLPFVWKEFAKKNYLTALLEDCPEFTLFNYIAKGFKQKPTDWYLRPYWLHIYGQSSASSLSYCYNKNSKLDLFLEQVKIFLEKARDVPKFLFSFFIEVTHTDFNKAQLLDSHYAKFINEQKDQLNDSIVFLMGDHGNRYGAFLETNIGRIEERMPLLGIHLPIKLTENEPHLAKFLRINSERLTTWLDAYQLLLDVAHSNYTIIEKKEKKRQYSLWREEVPVDRTCNEALIPDNYCVCEQKIEVNGTEKFVQEAARILVDH